MQYTDLGLPIPISPGGSGRTLLSSDTTYYIRTDGSDSNTGTTNTSGGAWLTLQHAIDYIVANLDFGGFTLTIQIGDGTYAGATSMNSGWTGGGALIIQGNATTPTNVILSAHNANLIQIEAGLPGFLTIQNLQITTTRTAGNTAGIGIFHSGTGTILISGIDCAAIALFHFATDNAATIAFTGNYTISGGGGEAHYGAFHGSHIAEADITVTITNSPTFTYFALASQCGSIESISCTFSGSLGGGERYLAEMNGVINTASGGPNYFPGTSAGSTDLGGVYN